MVYVLSHIHVYDEDYTVLYSDAGCKDKWTKKMREIRSTIPAKVSVSDLIEKHVNEKQLECGD